MVQLAEVLALSFELGIRDLKKLEELHSFGIVVDYLGLLGVEVVLGKTDELRRHAANVQVALFVPLAQCFELFAQLLVDVFYGVY